MIGHPAYTNRRAAIRNTSRDVPYEPFRPEEVLELTVSDINCLPVLRGMPNGWELLLLEPPVKEDTLQAWRRATSVMFQRVDAGGGIMGLAWVNLGDEEPLYLGIYRRKR